MKENKSINHRQSLAASRRLPFVPKNCNLYFLNQWSILIIEIAY